MRYVRSALLCAAAVAVPLAMAAAAKAQTPAAGMVLYDAAGTPVAILTPLHGAAAPVAANDPDLNMIREMEAAMNAPFDGGFQQFFATQEASMRAVQNEMQSVMRGAFSDRGQTIEVAIPPAGTGQVSGTYVWSVASGQGHCAETVTFSYSPDGGPPILAQRKTGNVCGKWDQSKTGSMPAMTPPAPQRPTGPRLIEVSGPARPIPALHG